MNKQQHSRNTAKKYRRFLRKTNNTGKYQYSSKTQTLGVGRTSVRVTRYYTITESEGYSDYALKILYDSVTSPEFNRMATDYTYCKLKLIIVTISPRNIQTDTMNFFKMQWNDGVATDVRYDDNAKLIYTNVTYPKIYRFKPPNVMIVMPNNTYINYNEWIQCTRINGQNIPGCLKITSAVSFTFQVEAQWVFRGLNSVAPTTKMITIKPENTHNDNIDEAIFELKKIAHKIDKIEEQQEEEEELEEEEEKIEDEKEEKEKKDKIKIKAKKEIKKEEGEEKEQDNNKTKKKK
jgi:hypothetical protein